ncbi:hypothetical protein ACIOG7_12090 [Streptomyces sp. NPDC087894]|uniref:hypothetical protein n=1 Tax=Streptomyces sp. NPDC087894 TaxID=3365816 RepID=UPI0038187AEF
MTVLLTGSDGTGPVPAAGVPDTSGAPDATTAPTAPTAPVVVLPLTAAQSGMWFAQSLDPLSPAQNTAE